jgi:hypothetical protein
MNVIKCLKLVLLAVFLTLMFGHSYSKTSTDTTSVQLQAVGRVVWVNGPSFKAMSADNSTRTLQKTSVIYLYDRLVTDAKTQAEIVFTDDTLITFHPATDFTVDNYAYDKNQKSSVGKSVMSLIQGGFRTITGLIAKGNPSGYAVKTPVATIGVRGTDYTVQLDNGQLFIGYNHGVPCVTSNKVDQTLCLDDKTPYAKVSSANAAPQGLTVKPDELDQQTLITPAKIAGFGTIKNSSVTSFCISQ